MQKKLSSVFITPLLPTCILNNRSAKKDDSDIKFGTEIDSELFSYEYLDISYARKN